MARIRLYGFLGPIGVSVPLGRHRRARRSTYGHGPRRPRAGTVAVMARHPWVLWLLWFDVVGGGVALAVYAPVTLVVTVPLVLGAAHLTHRVHAERSVAQAAAPPEPLPDNVTHITRSGVAPRR